MKKFLSLSLALLMLLSLAACGSAGLSEEYDEAEVLARAKELVLLINTLDYEAVCGQLREDLSGAISPEELENAWGESLEKARGFCGVQERGGGQPGEQEYRRELRRCGTGVQV